MARVLVVAVAVLFGSGPGGVAGASAGSVDRGFGVGGAVQTDLSRTHLSRADGGFDLLVQPDGKTITTGFADQDGVLLRHRVDGTLDPAFGVGGVVRTSPQSAYLDGGVLQDDGRIVVVGSDDGLDDVVVFRYLPSGAPDPTFGTGGAVSTDFGDVDQAYGVALQPDGRIVVGGRSGEAAAVARYLPNGTLDPTFGTGGRTTTGFGPPGTGPEVHALGVLSTGAIVVGGRALRDTGAPSMLLARYTAAGVLDGTFGVGGRVATADERLTGISSLVVQPGDRVVVAGVTGPGLSPAQGLARYRADGSPDPTFGTAGSTSTPLGVASTAEDIAVDGTGRLVTVGSVRDQDIETEGFVFASVSRFSSEGVPDATFGCRGSTQVELNAAGGGRATGVAVAPDGRILVGGSAFVGSDTDGSDLLLARVLAGGASAGGYWVSRADGGTSPFGAAGGCGSLRGLPLAEPVVGHAARPSGDGYWFAAADGGVLTRGDAPFLGSAAALRLSRPIVGMARTPSGDGYWLVASDGGIFSYGDAGYFGSTGGLRLNRPVVGMAASPTGRGYWLVASDGGIFAFGDARFVGSTGGVRLNQPVVGMAAAPTGNGYWLAARDGGIFAFGGAGFHGSTGGIRLDRPVIGMTRTASGNGYWLAGADGGVFTFGDAAFLGSTGGQPFTSGAVAITSLG